MEEKQEIKENSINANEENESIFLAQNNKEDAKNEENKDNIIDGNLNYKNLMLYEPQTIIEILKEDRKQCDFHFKVIVIGNSGVGKSCLSLRATQGVFKEDFISTIGFEFYSFNIKINNDIVKLQIWDTCGQELYRSLITNFYRNSSLAIIVYTVTDRQSFDNIDLWYKELRTHSNPNVKVFLIGNKIDLDDQRKVKTEEGQRYAEQYKLNKFVETSAKSGFNAKNIFIEAAKLLCDDYILYHKDILLLQRL